MRPSHAPGLEVADLVLCLPDNDLDDGAFHPLRMDLNFSRSGKSLRKRYADGRLHFPGRRYYTDGQRILSPTNRSGGAAMPMSAKGQKRT